VGDERFGLGALIEDRETLAVDVELAGSSAGGVRQYAGALETVERGVAQPCPRQALKR
jgi:hypothetical protein